MPFRSNILGNMRHLNGNLFVIFFGIVLLSLLLLIAACDDEDSVTGPDSTATPVPSATATPLPEPTGTPEPAWTPEPGDRIYRGDSYRKSDNVRVGRVEIRVKPDGGVSGTMAIYGEWNCRDRFYAQDWEFVADSVSGSYFSYHYVYGGGAHMYEYTEILISGNLHEKTGGGDWTYEYSWGDYTSSGVCRSEGYWVVYRVE